MQQSKGKRQSLDGRLVWDSEGLEYHVKKFIFLSAKSMARKGRDFYWQILKCLILKM